MRQNEYTSIEEFIDEYSKGREFSWQNSDNKERYMGIEFENGGKYYRMCREPFDEKYSPKLANGKIGLYNVTVLQCKKYGYPTIDSSKSIGWYDSLESLLQECILDGKWFRDAIIDDDTCILGKD